MQEWVEGCRNGWRDAEEEGCWRGEGCQEGWREIQDQQTGRDGDTKRSLTYINRWENVGYQRQGEERERETEREKEGGRTRSSRPFQLYGVFEDSLAM